MAGKSEVLATFESEKDRVGCLEEHLGVTLSEEEVEGIRDMVSEIR